MKIFGALYDWVLTWSAHRRAPWFLGGLSFAEATFFPIPPDVMLIPMSLAKREKAWFFAALCTVASVLGGVAGYLIGGWAFEWIQPWLSESPYWDKYLKATELFASWGFWFVLIAGFTPIPFKIITIAAGVSGMPLIPFVLGSTVGRGARFFLVSGLIIWGGDAMASQVRKHIEMIGWVTLLIVVVLIAYLVMR